ncbi:GGDEF domain-containing protein [Streptacidiphilus pinicola]|uniref:GGDEF domain-containing protein n=1 Tax=Streptacidiphilus pinicola TaxID=2219663 RepID=A0A2X0IVR0_9ACTN|nr:GGDEF domain-containing protein [Streptacidiphilus pinicola]RAG81736.1 GGDEF domain-containing protein [Streptacidiphilus pinicola]
MPQLTLPRQHRTVLAAALPLSAWAVHTGVLTARLRAARRDPLTGVLTRHGFEQAARRTLTHPNGLLVFVDLDRFKQVNDTHGHAAGDAILTRTATALTVWAGPRGVVGRFGGDEFTAALTVRPDGIFARLGALAAALAGPTWEGLALDTAASVGAVRPAELPVPSLSAALAAADAAMYEAKQHGGNLWALADAEHMHPNAARRWDRNRPATTTRRAA